MLLFTRRAPPKLPKKRSRAGCTYCKEKKKKCDETRPRCSRCAEKGHDCVYETVKPRQRRRRDFDSSTSSGPSRNPLTSPNLPRSSHQTEGGMSEPWGRDEPRAGGGLDARIDPSLFEALEGFDDASFGLSSGAPLPSTRDTGSSLVVDAAFESQLSGDRDNKGYGDSDDRELAITRAQRQDHFLMNQFSDLLRLDFPFPNFSEFSNRRNRRALVDHFCSVLSHLIVFKEEQGNPFQKLVLPLCQKSDVVMNALCALTSAHLEYRGVAPRGGGEKSVYFHNQSIQGISLLIQQGFKAKNELLAAIMLLVYYEVLVQQGRSNIVDEHLRGAMTVINSNSSNLDATSMFLERAFRFYDVIAALSLGTAPLSSPPDAIGLAPFPPPEDTESRLSNVDTLLGMATTLWPIIHRLSTLRSMKARLDAAVASNLGEAEVTSLRTEFETTSHAIDVALKKWQPCLPQAFSLDDDHDIDDTDSDIAVERARVHSILNNALAYRHSAFVYLYRAIYGYPRRHALVQRHAHVALAHCVATVVNEGPMGALLWPLFVASCEAASLGDRGLARQAFVAVERRQGMMNIERAWVIVQEVWRRADYEEANEQLLAGRAGGQAAGLKGKDLWRTVSEEMGVTIVFG